MKNGMKSLTELAMELDRQQETKFDFVGPMGAATLRVDTKQSENKDGDTVTQHLPVMVMNGGDKEFPVTNHAQRQLATFLEVPANYWEKMREEAPDLLVETANTWMSRHSKTNRLFRTLDGRMRAFFSDKYKIMDARELLFMVVPVLKQAGVVIESLDLTDQKMYLKVSTPKLQAEVKPGDVVQAGLMISTSEIGLGAQDVRPFIKRLVCVNGLIIAQDYADRKYHIGKKQDIEDAQFTLLKGDTISAIREAEYKRMRDVIDAFLNGEGFAKIVEGMKALTEVAGPAEPMQIVERVSKKFGLLENETSKMLTHLIRDDDYSGWGIVNAVTRTAEDVPSYDRATELEALGGKILTLAPKDWKEILAN